LGFLKNPGGAGERSGFSKSTVNFDARCCAKVTCIWDAVV
jgi:hypothetical protein